MPLLFRIVKISCFKITLQKIANSDVKKYPLLFISDNDGNHNLERLFLGKQT